jgi:nucleoside-diphosphate-sugar epimerase
MVRAYLVLIKAYKKKINREIFNIGSTNHSVKEIAEKVKSNIGKDVKLIQIKSDDIRSYHISSEKIFDKLGFKTELTIEDAILDLKKAFDQNLLENTLENENYFNIKKMQMLELK